LSEKKKKATRALTGHIILKMPIFATHRLSVVLVVFKLLQVCVKKNTPNKVAIADETGTLRVATFGYCRNLPFRLEKPGDAGSS